MIVPYFLIFRNSLLELVILFLDFVKINLNLNLKWSE